MASATWTCPVCQRRVPLRVEECWCGFLRSEAERHAAQERGRQDPGAARELIGIVIVLLLGLGLYVQRQGLDPQQPQAAASAGPTALPAAERDPGAPPSATPEPSPSPSEGPAPLAVPALDAADPPPSPAVETSTKRSGGSADERRETGLVALEQAYRQATSEGRQLGNMFRKYEGDCIELHAFSPRIANCAEIQARLSGYGRDLVAQLEAAEEQARRSWVRPGDLRELRQRLGVDEAENTARQTLKR